MIQPGNLTAAHCDDSAIGAFHRWLSLNQIRKLQRMRREAVVAAMNSGELSYERRGHIRYARLSDVIAWEERRLSRPSSLSSFRIRSDLLDLL